MAGAAPASKRPLKILMVAAEASSATYAEHLLEHWKKIGQPVEAYGIGSRRMEELGFHILGRSEELAVMGLQEIIAHWGVIKKAFYALLDQADKDRPDLVLLMDYPEFNLRLAEKMKKKNVPVVYYISPQIWAWRTYRVHKIKRIVDLMLVIFPFEKDFYAKFNVPVDFVGHPLLDLLDQILPSSDVIRSERNAVLKNDKTKILGLMPGSRRSEIQHNLETQIKAAELVVKDNPEIEPVLLVAPPLDEDWLRAEAAKFNFTGSFVKKDPFLMISLSDSILCASGTATLMVALCQVPMVIMYRMNSFSAFMAKRLVRHIPYFGMVNLILNEEAVPERFQNAASPEELSRLLLLIDKNPSGYRDKMIEKLILLKKKLGSGGGIARLAQAIETFVAGRARKDHHP